jgi:hypothetical protein
MGCTRRTRRSPVPSEQGRRTPRHGCDTSVYDNLAKTFGRVPNIFGVMAHRPSALKTFVLLYGAVMNEAPPP